MNIIAIDIGASFLKAGLFTDGKLQRKIHRKSPRIESDWKEPVQINRLVEMVRTAVTELADGLKEATIAISNEMHGFILTDKDGRPLTDYISWQREFGNLLLSDGTTPVSYFKGLDEEVHKTGMNLRTSLPSANLRYVIDTIGCGNCFFYTLGDYIIYALSGRRPVCHVTNAAATGLFDLKENRWNYKLIEAAEATNISFPEVGSGIMEFSIEKTHLNVLPAIGDQQATLLGTGFENDNDNDISFNLGTGAQVSRLVKEPSFSDKWQIRPYFDGMYLKTIPHLPSGRAVNVYFRFVKEIATEFNKDVSDDDIWAYILDEAGKSDGTISCDLSFFANPCTDNLKGSIAEIGEYDMRVGNLFHSIFDQMSDNFLWAAEILSDDMPEVSRVVFSGGIADRISLIREKIMSRYPHAENIMGDDESLRGLCKYAERMG